MPTRPTFLYRFVAVLSHALLRLVFRLEERGLENLPRDGGYVLAAGHRSNLDPWSLGTPLYASVSPRRFVRFMTKSELFWFPLSAVLVALGGFEVRRGEADRRALATARRLVREGNVLAMFPEGTRRVKGARKKHESRVHDGAARIALAAGVPLVPAGITGTDKLMQLGPVKVAYGKPIRVDDLEGLGRRQAARIATTRLMEEIQTLEQSLAGT
jgi:1-acyl-sn-glycerol-3-phosphate acyltransferase